MPVFTIDGNIGAGKSTILEYLHTQYGIPIDLEPVDKWQPFLEEIYYNGQGIFQFQIQVWLDRCYIQPKSKNNLIMERSPYFQRNVFIPANYDNGKLSLREFNTLQEMYERSGKLWSPSGYIYLRSNPVKCTERIKVRSRTSEEAISEEYIQKLHTLHENAYFYAASQGIPIICIDVEGKQVAQIAREVWIALNTMGLRQHTNMVYDVNHNRRNNKPKPYNPPRGK